MRFRQQIEALDGGVFIAQAINDLEARLQSLSELAASLTDPYTPSSVLLTDENGAANWNRLGWTDVPYNAANFESSFGGTWTVQPADVAAFRYLLFGGLMFLNLRLRATSLSAGTDGQLVVYLPGGWRGLVSSQFVGTFHWQANASDGIGIAFVEGNALAFLRDLTSTTAFPNPETNTFSIGANLVIPVYHPTLRPLQTGEAL